MFSYQVENHTGVYRPAARAHNQAVYGSKTHCAGDAAAGLHGAQARAVAKVRHNDTTRGQFRVQVPDLRCQVLVREAMEPVAPDAVGCKLTGKAEGLGQMRLRTMKGGVEAGHLWNLRDHLTDRSDDVQ